MRVIGTAGHIDHGKSTLVRRLTGIDPDRLKEEKARKLTIDLGFAWFSLDGHDDPIGIVDVPGHRDFIENMLAGVGSIDVALIVIAADEGVMPQTREHLAILDLLGIENSIIVLSKVDLVQDDDWLELITLDITETLEPTAFADAPIIPVSAHTGEGIDTLLETLSTLLQDAPPRLNYNQPRLPIDRVFTVDGFGTVVTGTLSGGTLCIGDTVEIQPEGIDGRIRGLQSYEQSIDIAYVGSRVAVNISGIHKHDISRGSVLAYPDQLATTQLIDVHFRYLADAEKPLKHNTEVKFFSGATETIARVRLLNDDVLMPDSEGWLQLRLRDPLPLTNKDRFILRLPSPAQTIGGGVVVNTQPHKRWKRFRQAVIEDLEIRLQGSPAERIMQVCNTSEPVSRSAIQKQLGYADQELDTALEEAVQQGYILRIDDSYIAATKFNDLLYIARQIVGEFHNNNPLRLGLPLEHLRRELSIKQRVLSAITDTQDFLVAEGLIRLANHDIQFTPQQQSQVDGIMQQLRYMPFAPPSFKDLAETYDEQLIFALIDLGDIIMVDSNVIFASEAYHEMVKQTLSLIDEHDAVDAKLLRDHFGSSRKYAISFLEYLDTQRITKRIGDTRVRGQGAS